MSSKHYIYCYKQQKWTLKTVRLTSFQKGPYYCGPFQSSSSFVDPCFLSLFLCFTQFCGSFHCLFGKFFDIISKTSQQLSKVTQWFAQIFESVKISPRWHMLPFDCTANAFEPFGRCLPLLHRQILIDNDKNIDSSKQAGHNVVLIPAYWPPGGFADVDLPWICNGM